jgi:hypothetical protein
MCVVHSDIDVNNDIDKQAIPLDRTKCKKQRSTAIESFVSFLADVAGCKLAIWGSMNEVDRRSTCEYLGAR